MQNSEVRRLLYLVSASPSFLVNSFTAYNVSWVPIFLCDSRTTPKVPLPNTSWQRPYFSCRDPSFNCCVSVGPWPPFCCCCKYVESNVGGNTIPSPLGTLALALEPAPAPKNKSGTALTAVDCFFALPLPAPSQDFTIWPNFSCLFAHFKWCSWHPSLCIRNLVCAFVTDVDCFDRTERIEDARDISDE